MTVFEITAIIFLVFEHSPHPPGKLPSGQLLLMKFPPGQLPPGLLPHGQLSLNSFWTIAHNKIPPRQLPSGLVPPGHLFPLEQLSPENCPIKFFPEQRTSALDNYPLIIYRWLSKKTLFTHSNIRSNPENKYIFKVNNRNIRRSCDMFKVNDNDSRTMTSFCSVVDRGQ